MMTSVDSQGGGPQPQFGLAPGTSAEPVVSHIVTAESRAIANGHRGAVLWLTGLPGSGKSTIAMGLERELFRRGRQVFVLDGDFLRQGISSDLGFSSRDRSENARRAAEMARLFAEAGMIVVVATISPAEADRVRARRIVGSRFREIYVKAELATCERRDPKGHYKAARESKLDQFTGVSAPYEAPQRPDLVIDTDALSVEASVARLLDLVNGDAAPLAQVDAWAI
jgi:bifunctional enzyme CysN/CysC